MQWGWGPARRAARHRAAGMTLVVAVPAVACAALVAVPAPTTVRGARPVPAPAVDRLARPPGGLTAKPGRALMEAPPTTSAPARPATLAGLLADPAGNLLPVPAFQEPPGPCWGPGGSPAFSQPACLTAEVRATDHARAGEGLPAMTLPADFASLTAQEQMFVLADLERVSRGLQPVLGLSTALDRDAQQGASDDSDPGFSAMATLPSAEGGVSNWGASMSALDVNYYWMYLDGWGGSAAQTFNVDCPAPGATGCWAHRGNVLMPDQFVVMGAGFTRDNWNGYNSYAEVLVALGNASAAPPLYYTWSQAVAAGAAG